MLVFSRREAIRADGQTVAVGGVEHRAVDDAGREVGRAAAIGVERDIVGADAAFVVEADAPIVAERVAFAGQLEIVVAVEPAPCTARR